MHGAHVDAARLELHGNTGGERADVSLGGAIECSEGGRLARGSGRGEDHTSLEILGEHAGHEEVGDLHRRGGVALVVRHQFCKRLFIEEACEHEASVVEDQLHVYVLGRLCDRVQVARSAEVHPNLDELAFLELRLKLADGIVQELLLQRNQHDVDALLRQLDGERLADATGGSRDNRPLGVVLFLEVLCWHQRDEHLRHPVGPEHHSA
mmetsp:Transcript_40787/g.100764  ORF Transcript_40787/g.100764 Transcript_40787/m.100764 type:complete len:209 (-) Transcript_40787:243-869(-)